MTTTTAGPRTPTTSLSPTVFSAISSLASQQQRKRSASLGLHLSSRDIAQFQPSPTDTPAEPLTQTSPKISLAEFIAGAWPILEPATGYQHNWHLEVLTSHLEAISRGELQDLLINVPPGFMKSLTVSVFWPAWEWTWLPWTRWLFTSYDGQLSIRDALKTRRLIESEWYQQRWGHVFKLTSDQNQKTRFENNRTGWRIASSINGLATGEHAHRRVADDPHKVKEAESDPEREGVVTAWKETMTSRGIATSPLNARVMVMQRVHEQDVAADWLEREPQVHHICLPNEYEAQTAGFEPRGGPGRGSGQPPAPSSTGSAISLSATSEPTCSIVPHEVRQRDGELLWPAMVDQAETNALKTTKLGPYAYAGQYQQRPTPRAGMVLDPAQIGDLPHLQAATVDIIMAWDLNYSSKDASDWTVGMVAAVDKDPVLPRLHILDVFRHHLTSEQHDQVIADWIATWRPILVGIERRAYEHQGATQDLIRRVMVRLEQAHVLTTLEPIEADTDKLSRAMIIPGRAKAGLITANKRAPWWGDLSREMSSFPRGAHDDQVDALAYLVRLAVEKLSMVRNQQMLLGHSARLQYVQAEQPAALEAGWAGLVGSAR